MGRKANPAVIGAFVVGAIALVVIGLVVFGSGRLFKETSQFVLFFPGAVDGLDVGAPVRFKGVEIGTVTDIRLRLPQERVVDTAAVEQGIRIPVFVELDHGKLASEGGRAGALPERMKELIDLGLRAQLNAQSLVTGLLFVALDFHPDNVATFVLPPGSGLQEIPTVPTTMEQVQSAAAAIIGKLEAIKFDKLVELAGETVDGINRVINSPALKKTIDALPETVAGVNEAVASIRELVVRLDSKQGPLLSSLKDTSDKAGAALEQGRVTLGSVQTLVEPDSVLATQLTAALQEMSSAARSVRLLADYLERNPSAIVRGKDVTE